MRYFYVTTALALTLSATSLFAQDKPGEGVTVRPVVQPVLEEYFQARVVDHALKDLGYTIAQPQEVLRRPHISPSEAVTPTTSQTVGISSTTRSSRKQAARRS